jgi:hypothetical protein
MRLGPAQESSQEPTVRHDSPSPTITSRTRRIAPLLGSQRATARRRSIGLRPALAVVLVGALLSSALTPERPAAALSTAGTTFPIAFLANISPGPLSLFVTGPEATTGTVTGGPLSAPIDFSVTPGEVTTIELPDPATIRTTATTGVQAGKGLLLTAGAPVTVYGLNQAPATTDGFIALPLDVLGTRYRVSSIGDPSSSQYGVLATQDATTVTLPDGGTVALDAGDVYTAFGSDSTGALITSDKPVALFAGHLCSSFPGGACDHLISQVPPTSTWGKEFVTIRFANEQANSAELFRIVADEDGTVVELDGTVIATLDAGAFHEDRYFARSSGNGPMVVGGRFTANKPVLISHFMRQGTYRVDDVTTTIGDPAMYLLAPSAQFQTSYTLATMATGFVYNAINVVIPTAAIPTFRLNGAARDAAEFTAIGETGYSGAQITIPTGTSTLSAGQPFSVVLYGANPNDSYATIGGMSLAPVALLASLTASDVVTSRPVDDGVEVCFSASLRDSGDAPLSGIRADFTVTGVITATGSANSGSDGTATFCTTVADGTTGTVSITVTSGSLSDATSVTVTISTEQQAPDGPTDSDDPTDTGGGTDTGGETPAPTPSPSPAPSPSRRRRRRRRRRCRGWSRRSCSRSSSPQDCPEPTPSSSVTAPSSRPRPCPPRPQAPPAA